MTRSLVLTLGLMATSSAFASKVLCNALPQNNLIIPTKGFSFLMDAMPQTSVGGLSEVQFNGLISKLETYYQDQFHDKGVKLTFKSDWQSPKVDATATLDDNDNPLVVVHGGLARHPLMTADAFVGFLCHEMGHFLGGAPKIPRGNSGKYSWSSAEGQADYFASTKCLKSLFQNQTENAQVVANFSPQEQSDLSVRCVDRQCMRISMAGKVMSKVIADVTGKSLNVAVATPDPSRVSQTQYKHPAPQCRLDTFVAGANCGTSLDQPFDDQDPNLGACVERANEQGTRPRCWFKPID